ncbi:hypothetical protein M0802_013662 [Mischocyttarus mexicanus]|nr:hypothetical protein M0802_013662 [Mischocyttarus mexicanus]
MMGENNSENVKIGAPVIVKFDGEATSDVNSYETKNIVRGKLSKQLRNKKVSTTKSSKISSVSPNVLMRNFKRGSRRKKKDTKAPFSSAESWWEPSRHPEHIVCHGCIYIRVKSVRVVEGFVYRLMKPVIKEGGEVYALVLAIDDYD